MASVHEQLSEQFYQWESRGRGWQVFSEPVYPEPPFRFFNGYRLPAAEVVDDGRRPTFLSSLFRKVSQPPPAPVVEEVEEDPKSGGSHSTAPEKLSAIHDFIWIIVF